MCEHIPVEGGTVIVCGMRRQRPRECAFCGAPSTKQCDFPVAEGKTCDAYMCDSCSAPVGENLDHCIGHARVGKRYRVIIGSHEGHTMLLLAWRKVPKRPGVRQTAWKYAAQCSCMKAGDLEAQHLFRLDLTTEVAA